MSTLVESRNAAGNETVRLSDEDLHRAACKAIWESGRIVFESLPNLVGLIIKHQTWKSNGHKSFADYALDTTSKGLGINTNQRLWILRCSMDVYGEHISEWADVLAKVEEMVRIQAASENTPLTLYNGNSLKSLGKSHADQHLKEKITYLPSRNRNTDGQLLRLHGSNKGALRKVAKGGLSLAAARRAAGIEPNSTPNPVRAKACVRSMTPKEREEFIDWLREEGYL